jgi:adenylate cyclase
MNGNDSINQERTKRKLSAILSADVFGYSRLMEENETNTIQTLAENKRLIAELVEEYKGRIVDATGDNILAEFNSVVNSVDCAVAIQKKVTKKNTLLSEKDRMAFRIGVNLGDVVDEDGRIYGDGVNIAARLEGLAEPGGICISRMVHDQVKSKLKLGYEYLGEHVLKNITEPVRIYRVLMDSDTAGKVISENRLKGGIIRKTTMLSTIFLFFVAAGSAGWIIYSHMSQKMEAASLDRMAFPRPEKVSIAVLPFENLSGDHDQDYFSDGLTEEIVTGLSKHPDLLVASRSFSSAYKNKPVKIQEIHEDLSVHYVLTGSVRRDGSQVRITAQLIDASKGYNIWTETYNREFKEILPLQSEIMWHIFREVRIELIDGEREPDFLPVKRDNIEYLEIFHLMYRDYKERSPERLQVAKQLADQLITMQPDPWVYYMRGAILIAMGGGDSREEQYLQLVKDDAVEAQKLDMGAGFALLGMISFAQNDLGASLDYYQKWLEFSPNSANANFSLGFVFLFQERYDDAIIHFETGLHYNPQPETQQFIFLGIAYSKPTADGFSNLEKAINFLKRSLFPNQNSFLAHLYLTLIYAYDNQMDKAQHHAKEMLRLSPFFSLERYRSWLFSDEGIIKLHKALLRKAGIPEKGKSPGF